MKSDPNVITKTRPDPIGYDEGLELCRKFTTIKTGNAAALLMQEDGQYYLWYRMGEPCYGFLRTYGPDSTRPQDRRPGDLPNDFPSGNPVVLALPMRHLLDITDPVVKEFYDWWFDPERSPYKDALLDIELMENGVQYIGIVVKDTNVDSTLLIQFLRQTRYLKGHVDFYKTLVELLPAEDKDFLKVASFYVSYNGAPLGNVNPIIKFAKGDWDRDVTGGTFHDRYAYNRPDVDYVFGRVPSEQNISKRIPKSSTRKDSYGYEFAVYDLKTSISFLKEELNAKV